MGIFVRVLFNRLPEELARIEDEADKVVASTAESVADLARSLCRVDTGSAQAGIYTITSQNDGYSAAAGAGVAADPKAKTVDRLAVEQTKGKAWVGQAIEHGMFLELGTVKMASEPYLTPAAENQTNALVTALTGVLNG